MHPVPGTRWPLVLVCLLLAAGSGCASQWRWPWDEKQEFRPELYAKTATARQEAIQQATQGLAKKSPAEQQQIVANLAQQIQNEPDPQVRRDIVRAISQAKTEYSGAVLNAALQDSNPAVREAACVGWGLRGGPEAARLLGGVLTSDTNLDVRLAAAKALGTIKDPASVTALSLALDDKDVAIQYRAVESLRTTAPVDLGDDVATWRQYAKTGHAEPKHESVATRFWSLF